MTYCPLLYRLRAQERYLIWVENDPDLVVTESGRIPTFKDLLAARSYADTKGYILKPEEPAAHDLDWISAWYRDSGQVIDCEKALVAWNLFRDIAVSVGAAGTEFNTIDAAAQNIYKKLFWGNNLPSVTPKGQHYTPEWSPEDRRKLGALLSCGLELFENCTLECLSN
jgi:hypothetical protein